MALQASPAHVSEKAKLEMKHPDQLSCSSTCLSFVRMLVLVAVAEHVAVAVDASRSHHPPCPSWTLLFAIGRSILIRSNTDMA